MALFFFYLFMNNVRGFNLKGAIDDNSGFGKYSTLYRNYICSYSNGNSIQKT